MTTIELRRDETGENDKLITRYPVEIVPVIGDTIFVSTRGWLVRVVSRHWAHCTARSSALNTTTLAVLGIKVLEIDHNKDRERCEHSKDYRTKGGSHLTWDYCECRKCGCSISRIEFELSRANNGSRSTDEAMDILLSAHLEALYPIPK